MKFKDKFDPLRRARRALLGGLLVLCGSSPLLGPIPRANADPRPSCGAPGRPACPLQRWMRQELATAWAHKDLGGLEHGFEALRQLNPEPKAWLNWDKFARDGAKAAREGRARGALGACGHCHSIYRREYNAKYRTRAVSGTH